MLFVIKKWLKELENGNKLNLLKQNVKIENDKEDWKKLEKQDLKLLLQQWNHLAIKQQLQ